jgi:ribosome-associated heat shock protein Hsp15
MRIDKLLWFLRLAPSRTLAHDWVLAGHMRINGRRVERASTAVKPGDVLTLPLHSGVRVIALMALPTRRGPASEAQQCYRTLDEPGANPIAAQQNQMP